jgi:hypothetical protein
MLHLPNVQRNQLLDSNYTSRNNSRLWQGGTSSAVEAAPTSLQRIFTVSALHLVVFQLDSFGVSTD